MLDCYHLHPIIAYVDETAAWLRLLNALVLGFGMAECVASENSIWSAESISESARNRTTALNRLNPKRV